MVIACYGKGYSMVMVVEMPVVEDDEIFGQVNYKILFDTRVNIQARCPQLVEDATNTPLYNLGFSNVPLKKGSII